MCNKLIVLCVALVVGLDLSASAAYIGFDNDSNSGVNSLKVDIVYAPDNQQPKPGWQDWSVLRALYEAIGQDFANPFADGSWEIPHAQLEAYRKNQTYPYAGFSRNRSGGFAAVGPVTGFETIDYSPTGKGFGTSYLKLTLTGLAPDTEYKFYLWSFEARNVWTARTDNPDSKLGCWSTTNPKNWLDAHGYSGFNGEPNGYGPVTPVPNPPTGASGMPAGLAELVAEQGGRASMIAEDGNDHLGQLQNYVSFYAPTDGEGAITIYGWIDPTDWTGNMHMPLNGFIVIPEPATVALVGLGGLSLLRRRKRANWFTVI